MWCCIVFFGHSLGALISFELARQLRRQGSSQPIHIIISGSQAPHLVHKEPFLHKLAKPEFIKKLEALHGTPEIVLQNSELMEILLPIIQADFAISETYAYYEEKPLNCSISVFGGLHDYLASYDDLYAWHTHTSNSFSLRFFPGDHFFINTDQENVLLAVTDILKNF